MVDAQFVNVIFGVKLRQARLEAGLTLSEFARRVEISPSYATEVEKGRKYPRVDKIMRMADVLNIPFNDLVSINLDPSLYNLESALSSSLISQFPFQEFGLDASDLVGLLTKAPAKASALLNAILEIGRQHDLKEEHFWLAALRSYQELHENYFPELEEAAAGFAASHDLWGGGEPVGRSKLEALLTERFRYRLDEDALAGMPALRSYRSVFVDGERPRLLLNAELHDNQIAFLLAREIGYRVLGLTERAMTSSPDQVDSFRQVLNDFKASYFAGALMMPQAAAVEDIQAFLDSPGWAPQRLLAMLDRYDVTPEMLLYRFSELVPRFFGLKLHFLRVQGRDNRYTLVKRLNMNRLLMPSGLALHEHYCRRWLVMRLLREMEAAPVQRQPMQATGGNGADAIVADFPRHSLHVGVQIDEFLQPRDRFLSIGFARPLVLTPSVNSSVVIGFQLDEAARERIRFLQDPAIPFAIINETCERCPLTAEECFVRAAPPTVYEAKRQRMERQAQLREVLAQFDSE